MNKNNFYGIDLTKNVSSNFLEFMTSIYNDVSRRFYTQEDNMTFNQKVRDDFDKLSKRYDDSVINDLKEKNYTDDAIAYYYDRERLYNNLLKVDNLASHDFRFKDNFMIDPDIIESLPQEILKKLDSYEEVKDSGMFIDTNIDNNMEFDSEYSQIENVDNKSSNQTRIELNRVRGGVSKNSNYDFDEYDYIDEDDLDGLDF